MPSNLPILTNRTQHEKSNFCTLLPFFATHAQAQFFSLGLKGGLNTQVNHPEDITIGGGDSPSILALMAANSGRSLALTCVLGKILCPARGLVQFKQNGL